MSFDAAHLGTPADEMARRRALLNLDGYIRLRLVKSSRPFLAAFFGPAGTGKSTLINTLAGADVTAAGHLRPTTVHPTIWAHRDHAERGWSEFVARFRERVDGDGTVVISDDPIVRHLTIIDTPPLDVAAEDSGFAGDELTALVDVCVHVASPGRYADEASFDFLRMARALGKAVVLVLNRLPPDEDVAAELVRSYADCLDREGLAADPHGSQIVGIREGIIDPSRSGLEAEAADELRSELELVHLHLFRTEFAERAIVEAVGALAKDVSQVAEATADITAGIDELAWIVVSSYQRQQDLLEIALDEADLASVADRTDWAHASGELASIATHRAGVAAQDASHGWAGLPLGTELLAAGGPGLRRHGRKAGYEGHRLVEVWADEIGALLTSQSRRKRLSAAARDAAFMRTWRLVFNPDLAAPRLLRWRVPDIDAVVVWARQRLVQSFGRILDADAARFRHVLESHSAANSPVTLDRLVRRIETHASVGAVPGEVPADSIVPEHAGKRREVARA